MTILESKQELDKVPTYVVCVCCFHHIRVPTDFSTMIICQRCGTGNNLKQINNNGELDIRKIVDEYSKEKLIVYVRDTLTKYKIKHNKCYTEVYDIYFPFEIIEDRYQLSNNYKIGLKSLDRDRSNDSFYISDFNVLVKQGSIKLYLI